MIERILNYKKSGDIQMTIYDAVEILEEIKELDDSIYAYNKNYLEALEMAIVALKMQNDRIIELTKETETLKWDSQVMNFNSFMHIQLEKIKNI